MPPDPPETLWTIEEFASWLRITTLAARAILRRRELPPDAVLKIGRRVRLRAELVKAWVLKRRPA
jgi:hypothetical protein